MRAFLDSDDGVAEVQQWLQVAREAEITAVPTFVFDGPEGQGWMVPGAQESDVFVQVLRRLADRMRAAGPEVTDVADVADGPAAGGGTPGADA